MTRQRGIVVAVIRGVLTTALLFMVYRETGPYTAIMLLLITFVVEALVWRVFG